MKDIYTFYKFSIYRFWIILLLPFFINDGFSQYLERQAHNSNGFSFKSGDLWLDYSIGEMAVETFSKGMILNQGFHQVYNQNENNINPLMISVFPNPNWGYIEIDIPNSMVDFSQYTIIDLAGKLIIGKRSSTFLKSNKTIIDIDDLPSGLYILSIQDQNNNQITNFKILKL